MKKTLLIFVCLLVTGVGSLWAQSGQVSGVVTEGGKPLLGATIGVKGSTTGVMTDVNGRYIIAVPENATLVYSFLGLKTQEVAVEQRAVIDVDMENDALALDEIVIVGYGTQNKKTLTGSVSVVNMQDVETSSKSTVAQSLQGKAAGFRVSQQSAQAGGGSKFRIRGEASTGAGNEPLIVIDGIPMSSNGVMGSGNIYGAGTTDNQLESINPDDIESITVLKDAASTAIYGARAGHGVILVTTKRGEKNKLTITYSGNVTVQQVAKNYEMLDARQFMELQNKYTYEEYLRMYGLGIYEGYVEKPAYTPKYVAPFTDRQIENTIGTDWIGEVTNKTATLQQHNLSLSGGTETGRYLVSANYMNQGGIVKGNDAQRFTVRANLDKDLGKYLSAGITANYSKNQYNNISLEDGEYEKAGLLRSAAQFNPTLPLRDRNGDYTIDPERATATNPVAFLEVTDKTVKDRLIGSAYLSAKPIAGLDIKFQLGADRRFQNRSNYLPKTTGEGKRKNGEAHISRQDNSDYLMDITATYTKSIEEHHIKALAGYSFQSFSSEGNHMGNSDFLIDGFLYYNMAAGSYAKPSVDSWASKSSLASYFGRVNYDYKDRYLLEGTVRADGASNFMPEHRWGYFPSVAVGWRISEESFMEPTRDWLSTLKVRTSYGETGNYNVGYHIKDFYGLTNENGGVRPGYVLGDKVLPGIAAADLGNPRLTWETTSELNIGIDVGLFRNRIVLAVEYFDREIRDLLSWQQLMSYYEVTAIAANIGKTQSQGFEITLNTVNIDNKDFGWSTTVTLSQYKDRWKERSPYWKPKPYESKNDYIRSVWSQESEGLLQPGEPAPSHQPSLLPGWVKLKNQNPDVDNVLGEEDMIFKGNQDPDFSFGFNNTLRYKNFDFNIYFYGETGMTKYASYKERWSQIAATQNVTTFAFEAFASDNLDASRPSILSSNWGDFYIKDVYFIRCGNIRLGYNIPISRSILKNCHAYVNVDNPFVITNWTGLDPETDNNDFAYPNIRAYTVGVNLTF